MRNFKNLILLVTLVGLFFVACKKEEPIDDPVPVDKHTLLVGKTWYNNPNLGRGEHIFNADGTVDIINPTWGGTYTWGPNDSMTVFTTGGVSVNWWFKTITEDVIEYWPTNEDPANVYRFTTTKP